MTIHGTGSPISMSEINAEFGLGNNLNAYRGHQWWTDGGSSGNFSSGAITMYDFYGKRATSPSIAIDFLIVGGGGGGHGGHGGWGGYGRGRGYYGGYGTNGGYGGAYYGLGFAPEFNPLYYGDNYYILEDDIYDPNYILPYVY